MFRSTCILAFAVAIGLIGLGGQSGQAQDAVNSAEIEAACPDEPKLRKKPRQVRDLTPWVMLISQLEIQDKENLTLRYEKPETSCEWDVIESSAGSASVFYSPFDTELESLLYRVAIEEESETREIFVLYSRIVSAVRDRGNHFYIAESRGIRTNFYAMYSDQPRYTAIRPLLSDILHGKATTLIAVQWPKGIDEALIVEIDKSLK